MNNNTTNTPTTKGDNGDNKESQGLLKVVTKSILSIIALKVYLEFLIFIVRRVKDILNMYSDKKTFKYNEIFKRYAQNDKEKNRQKKEEFYKWLEERGERI